MTKNETLKYLENLHSKILMSSFSKNVTEKEIMALVGYKEMMEELEQYYAIGTVSECQEAVEKQRAKKPIMKPWCPAICPMCEEELSESLGDGYYKHLKGLKVCPKCFQRLDWSDIP